MNAAFAKFSRWTARLIGRPATFVLCLALTLVWGISGPYFRFSDTWQLIINTSTTILTLFVALLIQNTQDRDMLAIQAKLDEIVKAIEAADNRLIGLEEKPEEEIVAIKQETRPTVPNLWDAWFGHIS